MKKPNSAAPAAAAIGASGSAELHRRAEMAQRQRGAIGAEPEIGGMAEADEAAGADQEMQREGEQAEDHDLGCDLQGIGVAEQRQQHQDGKRCERDRLLGRAPRPEPAADRGDMGAGRRLGAAEKAVRAQHEHDAHEQEHEDERDLREDQDAEGVELADDEGGEERARDRAHAADDGDDEGLGDDVEVHMRDRRRLRDLQRAAEAGQERAEEQRAGEQQRLVDAERADHLAVLRRGAHQDAEAGLVHEQPEQPEHDRAGGDQHELVGREAPAEDLDRRAKPGARGPRMSCGPKTRMTRSCTTSTTPKVASSWNSSGAR